VAVAVGLSRLAVVKRFGVPLTGHSLSKKRDARLLEARVEPGDRGVIGASDVRHFGRFQKGTVTETEPKLCFDPRLFLVRQIVALTFLWFLVSY
jgi:hypothetical protein